MFPLNVSALLVRNRKFPEVNHLALLAGLFRFAPVCKHASKARDPFDVFESDVQSGNGGVREWAWPDCVAVKMSMDLGFD